MNRLPRRGCAILFLSLTTAWLLACTPNPAKEHTSPSLDQSVGPSVPANSAPAVLEGYQDITNCTGIRGWAWDKNRPNEPVKVEIYDGDTLLATVTAGDFREDLLKAGIGNGKHGFTYPVPLRLKDDKPHSIRMKFAETHSDLKNTPKPINCTFNQP